MHHARAARAPRGRRTRRGAPPRPLSRRLGAPGGRLADQGLARTGDPADDAVVEAVRRALPAVGYRLDQAGHPARPLARRPRARAVEREDDRRRWRSCPPSTSTSADADADAGALRPRAGQRDAAGRPARRDRPGGRLGPRRPRSAAERRRHGCAAAAAGHRAHGGGGAGHPGGSARVGDGASTARGGAARPAGRGHRRPRRALVEPRLGAGRDAVLRGRPQPGAGRHPGSARARAGTPVGSPGWSTSPP